MINVGLVGSGPWAAMFHAPMLAAAPGLDLAGVWGRRAEARAELAERYGTTAAGSFEELLELCDAVVFSVPPDVQADYAPRAARAGKHLLLEKPLARDPAGAAAIAEAVDAAGVASMLLLTYRYTDAVRDFLATFDPAAVRLIRGAWVSGGALPGSAFATPWRTEPGAALLDIGPHTLDLFDVAAGPIESIRAAEAGGVTAITTAHRGGAVGQLAISITTPADGPPLDVEAVTDTARIRLADPMPGPADVARIAQEFARTVRGEMDQPIDVHRGVRVQALLAAAQESLRTGRAVAP